MLRPTTSASGIEVAVTDGGKVFVGKDMIFGVSVGAGVNVNADVALEVAVSACAVMAVGGSVGVGPARAIVVAFALRFVAVGAGAQAALNIRSIKTSLRKVFISSPSYSTSFQTSSERSKRTSGKTR